MNKASRVIVVVALMCAVAVVLVMKRHKPEAAQVDATTLRETTTDGQAEKQSEALPRLVDLGADKCIPCKMMAPILEELDKDYSGIFDVEFVDVWKNPDAGKTYGIRVIPTQIFYDAAGKELFRHEGFFSKADILMKWTECGLDTQMTEEK